jgi:teichuronic acid exporter
LAEHPATAPTDTTRSSVLEGLSAEKPAPSFRSRVMTAMLWTSGARLVSQVWTWAITIIVIRLLTPGDYGLLAMATVFIGFFGLVAEAGLGAALVQAKELDETMLRRVFGALIVLDGTLFLVQFALAPLAAQFFGEERLVWIIRVLALQFLLMIFTAIPSAMLNRKLDLKRGSIVSLFASILGSLTTLALALLGYGVWALVVSNMLVLVLQTIGVNILSPFLRWPKFSLKGLGGLAGTGFTLTGSRVLWFFYSQADVFIVGKILGKEVLGFYSVALHLATLPVQRLSSIFNQVAYPAFAEAQRNAGAIGFYILKCVRMLSIVAVPLLWGISAVAPEIVAVLVGPKWAPAVIPLQLLPIIMPLTMVGLFLNTAFQGIGQSNLVFKNSLTAATVLPIAFLIGVQWGLPGLSISWLLGYTTVILLNLHRMLPTVDLKIRDLARAAQWPVVAGVAMYGCVSLVRYNVSGALPVQMLAALLVAIGAVTYGAVMVATNMEGLRELVNLVRRRKQ